MEDILVYSAGVRDADGKYTQFIESRDRDDVDEYIEIMKTVVSKNLSIVFNRSIYRCMDVTPHVVRYANNDQALIHD